jgi:KipI family sensor histidine kinase inhibitor
MEIIPLGDSALIVRVRERFDDEPEQTLDAIFRVCERLRAAGLPGAIEFAPAYTSVGVFFDPGAVVRAGAKADQVVEWLAERIREIVGASADRGRKTRSRSQTVEIPVCYDAEFALDIDDVASRANISPNEVIRVHSEAEYRVACIGFVPGFPFLTGLPARLATHRRRVQRKAIPPGSVGIDVQRCVCSTQGEIHQCFCGRVSMYAFAKSHAMNSNH